MNIKEIHNVYFLGVGGIGMSALARYFNTLGKNVAGYDKVSKALTQELENEGIKIHFEDNITSKVNNTFDECFDMSFFYEMGYDFNYTKKEHVNVTINMFEILIEVDPIVAVRFKDSKSTIRAFGARVNEPIGALINSSSVVAEDVMGAAGTTFSLSSECHNYETEYTYFHNLYVDKLPGEKIFKFLHLETNKYLLFNSTNTHLSGGSCPTGGP